MKRGTISQEQLKLIACVTMLVDHFAVVLLWKLFPTAPFVSELYRICRIVGRLSFPIFCFLLAEGAHYTRNKRKYALRLAVGALLAELPYDLAFHGGWTTAHQSVMITLLLGYGALEAMKRCPEFWKKALVCLPFALVAEYLHTDYGAKGVILIGLFALTRELPRKHLWQGLGLWFLFSPDQAMAINWIRSLVQLGSFYLTTQEWAVLAIVPIGLYSGEKRRGSKVLQWAFYLFYPAHLLALHWIGML